MSHDLHLHPPQCYQHQSAALLTQHGKELILGPLLLAELGCSVTHVTGFDTDQLGTFTRDQARPGSQLDAARRKAEIGMDLSGLPLGLASEGAFVPDPHVGILPWDVEIVIWIDRERGLEIVGMAQGEAHDHQQVLEDWPSVQQFAAQADFPNHGLVLRPNGPDDPQFVKDLHDWAALEAAFHRLHRLSAQGQVFAESDLRAHRNPTRQNLIRQAGLDLIARLKSPCPSCATPGYAAVSAVPGLQCRACGTPTRLPVATLWRCVRCGHEERKPLVSPSQRADPSRCECCNP